MDNIKRVKSRREKMLDKARLKLSIVDIELMENKPDEAYIRECIRNAIEYLHQVMIRPM